MFSPLTGCDRRRLGYRCDGVTCKSVTPSSASEEKFLSNVGVGPKWEGPYLVTEAYHNGSYKLQTMDDREVPRTWHAIKLRRCYL
ncbi:hypothetical protein Tco_0011973 [Tanacetum coccineum]